MLLHYLGKFKSSNLPQIRKHEKMHWCIDSYMHPFNVTHWLTYCLITYYFSFWFLFNILWESILIYAKMSSVNSALHTGRNCTIFRLGNTSSTGPDLWPLSNPDLTLVYCKMWDVIQQRVCHLTLTNCSSIHEHLTRDKTQHNWQYS